MNFSRFRGEKKHSAAEFFHSVTECSFFEFLYALFFLSRRHILMMYGLHNAFLLPLDMLADHFLRAHKIAFFHPLIQRIVLFHQ